MTSTSVGVNSNQSLYNSIGGEMGVHQLVTDFYNIVESNPQATKLHVLHLRGHGIEHSRIEQFNFLSGFLGGPKLYQEKHGHANVIAMHEHVEINKESKNIWLECMSIAINKMDLADRIKHQLMTTFTKVAERLVNRD